MHATKMKLSQDGSHINRPHSRAPHSLYPTLPSSFFSLSRPTPTSSAAAAHHLTAAAFAGFIFPFVAAVFVVVVAVDVVAAVDFHFLTTIKRAHKSKPQQQQQQLQQWEQQNGALHKVQKRSRIK